MFGNWELQINIALKNQETTKQSRKLQTKLQKLQFFLLFTSVYLCRNKAYNIWDYNFCRKPQIKAAAQCVLFLLNVVASTAQMVLFGGFLRICFTFYVLFHTTFFLVLFFFIMRAPRCFHLHGIVIDTES